MITKINFERFCQDGKGIIYSGIVDNNIPVQEIFQHAESCKICNAEIINVFNDITADAPPMIRPAINFIKKKMGLL